MRLKILDRELYAKDDLSEGRYPLDAGIDLRARPTTPHGFYELGAGDVVKIPLGVAVELDVGYYGMVGSRSSTLLKYNLLTQEGKIDAGYRGEVHLIAAAIQPTLIRRGDRIAQLIAIHIAMPDWEVVKPDEELAPSVRGDSGFGSSGAE